MVVGAGYDPWRLVGVWPAVQFERGVERFEEAPEGIDIDLTSADKDDMAHAFSNGDNVEVSEGELVNLQGKVIAVDGSKITILPKHNDLKDPLEFQANELRKFFSQGCMTTNFTNIIRG